MRLQRVELCTFWNSCLFAGFSPGGLGGQFASFPTAGDELPVAGISAPEDSIEDFGPFPAPRKNQDLKGCPTFSIPSLSVGHCCGLSLWRERVRHCNYLSSNREGPNLTMKPSRI